MDKRTVERSWELHDRAVDLIPMATQTHAKAPRDALRGLEPCFLVKGKGCRVWDLDGNEYIDFRNGLGPITLGYGFSSVDQAIRRQLDEGIVFSYPHPLEVEVARRLVETIPCAERVRFMKTGGEAMAATHRLARVRTGRDLVLTCGYHGWLSTMSQAGVPAATRATYRALPWGDCGRFEEAFRDSPGAIAAVSVACSYADIEAGHAFLPWLRDLTERHGSLLIFDEIVTGFRLRRAGAQEYFGTIPDLAVFAKGIANGAPLSCYLGGANIMDGVEAASISSTFGGETLGLAAARAVLDVYEQEDVIGRLWSRGEQLHRGFRSHCQRLGLAAGFRGLPPAGQLVFAPDDPQRDAELFLRFNAEVLKRGIIIFTVCYPTFSHTVADIETAVEAMGEALDAMCDEGLFD